MFRPLGIDEWLQENPDFLETEEEIEDAYQEYLNRYDEHYIDTHLD